MYTVIYVFFIYNLYFKDVYIILMWKYDTIIIFLLSFFFFFKNAPVSKWQV